jgi:methylmalonyl-CoA mutase
MTAHDGGLPRELTLTDDFPTPALEDWRRVAEESLRGGSLERLAVRLLEGIDIQPLYTGDGVTPSAEVPGQPPFTRGRRPADAADRWQNAPRIDHPELATAASRISEALEGGADAVWLSAAAASRLGLDPDHTRTESADLDGVPLATVDDVGTVLGPALAGGTPVHLATGGAAPAVLALFIAAAARHGVGPAGVHGSVDLDPLGALAADGEDATGLDRSFALAADAAMWAARHAPNLRVLSVSTVPYHVAGATAIHELAFAMATAVATLRAAEAGGCDLDAVARQLRFVQALGRDVFLGIATLRALRRLWHRVATSCGVGDAHAGALIHATTSPRTLTARDPWTNLLRATTQTVAAVTGGADVVTTLEFDRRLGVPGDLGRRLARNTQTILREESHLGRIADPAGGSWYVESLTEELAHRAWALFQQIEREGGMRAAVERGQVAGLLGEALIARRRAVAHRRDPVTGVSTWPLIDEQRPTPNSLDGPSVRRAAAERVAAWRQCHRPDGVLEALASTVSSGTHDGRCTQAAIDAAAAGATLGQLVASLQTGGRPTRSVPLPSEPSARMFERLRDAADRALASSGQRPTAFLATLGPVGEHTARATFTRNLLAAGGIGSVDRGEFDAPQQAAEAFRDSGAEVAVICSSDARYAADAADTARRLKDAGARLVALAGRPGDHEGEWREAGIDRFVHADGDAHADLTAFLEALGVAP